jgi:hypothetical protein
MAQLNPDSPRLDHTRVQATVSGTIDPTEPRGAAEGGDAGPAGDGDGGGGPGEAGTYSSVHACERTSVLCCRRLIHWFTDCPSQEEGRGRHEEERGQLEQLEEGQGHSSMPLPPSWIPAELGAMAKEDQPMKSEGAAEDWAGEEEQVLMHPLHATRTPRCLNCR